MGVLMTDALAKVFSQAAKLPETEQQWLAEFIQEELASEQRWSKLLAESGDLLDNMIAEAIAEDDAGETLPLDPDNL